MPEKKDYVAIELDHTHGFLPGDTITGVLRLTTDLDKVSKVDLRLSCDTSVQCSNPSDTNTELPSMRDQIKIVTSTNTLWSTTKNVWPTETDPEVSSGTRRFNFELTLPKTHKTKYGKVKSMPPSFLSEDGMHLGKVEYKILASVTFKLNVPQLIDTQTITVTPTPITQQRHLEMTPEFSVCLPFTPERTSEAKDFFKKAFMKPTAPQRRPLCKFRILVIRPQYIKSDSRLSFKALLLSDHPPQFFKDISEMGRTSASVRRGEPPSTDQLMLTNCEISLITSTTMTIGENSVSMYEDYENPLAISTVPTILDLNKLVPYSSKATLGAHVSKPMKYMLDFTYQLPLVTIPPLSSSFETDGLKQAHTLKFEMALGFSHMGKGGLEHTEFHQQIEVVDAVLKRTESNSH